ncbi:MAG TPA: FtsX-like permease family protein, partial [Thermoanaerobaculia bacterium]|nr:FtsX-like permease family protein [Thermoanaerobaculia bacterium]
LIQILAAFETMGGGPTSDRLVVQSAFSLATMLPYAHEQKLRQVPGVVEVCKSQWLGGYYKERRNTFAILSVDADKFKTVFPEFTLSDEDNAAFIRDRQGAIVGDDLMKRFGWKIGDRITLHREIFPFDPELTIRGVVHHPVMGSVLYLHQDYFNEALKWNRVGTFWIKAKDPNQMAALSQQIDAAFKNSEDPTETFTEKEFNRQFVNMMGNIKVLFGSISLCSIGMIVLLAAITMSMAARERVTEVAVLKAIGFGRGLILALMLTEFVLTTFIGFVVGVGGAALLYANVDVAKWTMGFLPNFRLYPSTAAICAAAAVAVGLLAGGLPSMKSANLSVVDGLRKVV